MERYIDANKLYDYLMEMANDEHNKGCFPSVSTVLEDVADYISVLDGADVQEVKHGQWQQEDVVYGMDIEAWQSAKCSVCGRFHTTPFLYYFNGYNYCPHCGAKMDAEDFSKHMNKPE